MGQVLDRVGVDQVLDQVDLDSLLDPVDVEPSVGHGDVEPAAEHVDVTALTGRPARAAWLRSAKPLRKAAAAPLLLSGGGGVRGWPRRSACLCSCYYLFTTAEGAVVVATGPDAQPRTVRLRPVQLAARAR